MMKKKTRESKPKKRIDLQIGRGLEENISKLPNQCDIGVKRNSKGYQERWIGYKLHLDVADGDIPVSAILIPTCNQKIASWYKAAGTDVRIMKLNIQSGQRVKEC